MTHPMRAQGLANAHAAVAEVRRWGGACTLRQLRDQRLGRGGQRAVRMGLLCKNSTGFTLTDPMT
jgi:hypothetical protein